MKEIPFPYHVLRGPCKQDHAQGIKYEKHGIGVECPVNPITCIPMQPVCACMPHAFIPPLLLTEEEVQDTPQRDEEQQRPSGKGGKGM